MNRWKAYLVALYQLLREIFFLLLVLAAGIYVLAVPDQADDIIQAIVGEGVNQALFWGVMISAFAWGWITYLSARLILHISPVQVNVNRQSDRLLRQLPPMLGMLPVLALTLVFWSRHDPVPGLFLAAEMILIYGSFRWAEQWSATLALPVRWNFPRRFISLKRDFQILRQNPVSRLTLLLGGGLTLVALLCFCLPFGRDLARALRPAAVVILGVTVYTFLSGILIYFNDFRYRPFVLGVVIYLLIISAFNDNTAVRTVDSPLPARPILNEYFTGWVAARQNGVPSGEIPLVLVAAEGGGIRAMNWTADVLLRLDSLKPDFSRYVFALSGVSGGGVGALFYTAFLRDFPPARRSDWSPGFRRAIRDDFLSGVTAAFLFPESLQRVTFWPMPRMERGKWLEDAWSDAYRNALGRPTPDSSLISLYRLPNGSFRYDLPMLFLNGTLAESGQKTITSALRIDTARYFRDVVPVLDWLGADVPLKTAGSLCSRFPIVTNGALIEEGVHHPGTVRQEWGTEWQTQVRRAFGRPTGRSGHVIDGGYFDNTGIETCIQILNSLVDAINTYRQKGIRITPYILFIQNGDTRGKTPQAKSAGQILRIPLMGLYNSWETGSVTRDKMYNSFMNRFQEPPVNYLSVSLDHREGRFPLGWYLSDGMARRLHGEVRRTVVPGKPALDSLLGAIPTLPQPVSQK